MKNGFAYTSRVEAVPVLVDKGYNGGAGGWVSGGANLKILFEFGGITSGVPMMNIRRISILDKGRWGFAHGVAVLLKKEDGVINIIAIIQGDISISRLRAPNFGRNLNNKYMANSSWRVEGRVVGRVLKWKGVDRVSDSGMEGTTEETSGGVIDGCSRSGNRGRGTGKESWKIRTSVVASKLCGVKMSACR
jgi:hypothetical protein